MRITKPKKLSVYPLRVGVIHHSKKNRNTAITAKKSNLTFAHYGLYLSLSYLLVSFYGFYYDINYYKKFRINIAMFSRPEDFFFGWTRDFTAIITLSELLVVIFSIYFGFSLFSWYKGKTVKKPILEKVVWVLLSIVMITVFVSMILMRDPFNRIYFYSNPILLLLESIFLAITYLCATFLLLNILSLSKPNIYKLRIPTYLIILLSGLLLIPSQIIEVSQLVEYAYQNIVSGKVEKYSVKIDKEINNISVCDSCAIIGSNNSYLFLYDYKSSHYLVIPHSNLLMVKNK